MKPSWEDAPEWANWHCWDSDGSSHYYELKPVLAEKCGLWDVSPDGGRMKYTHYCGSDKDWKESLEERPK